MSTAEMSSVQPTGFDAAHFIEQIANGAYLRDLVKQAGISKQSLSQRLRKHPDYPAAKLAAIETQLDSAQEKIERAGDVTDIACAREAWKAATWRAEHELQDIYGTKPMTVNIGVQVSLTAVALGSIQDLLGAVVSTQQQTDSATDSAETLLNP